MIDRRRFLTILGSTVAATAAADVLAATSHSSHAGMQARPAAARGAMAKVYTFFTADEARFVEAAVARLIPADDLGPGALEADVPYFIDQQLMAEYGAGARFYRQGPFGEATLFQGYQLPLTPAELYRIGIAATDRYCVETYGRRFAALDGEQQDAVLSGLQGVSEDATLAEIPGAAFFGQLITNTKDGFFSDPAYGGNRDMIGWRLVGFPGVSAMYGEVVGVNAPYTVVPVDMRQLEEARIPVDHHGHPVHRKAAAPRRTEPPRREVTVKVGQGWQPGPSFWI